MSLLQNDYFRFAAMLVLTVQYSLLRATEYSTFIKPLPIIFLCLILLTSSTRPERKWVLMSLCAAFIGDILLDLGDGWLIIATVPFLGSTLLLTFAFHIRSRANKRKLARLKELLLLAPLAIGSAIFYQFTAPHTEVSARKIGAVLLMISALLLWRSLAVVVFKISLEDPTVRRWVGFLGASGIVANYLLYSINLSIHPVPRDLVIQVYYWGQAFVTWSFLTNRDEARQIKVI